MKHVVLLFLLLFVATSVQSAQRVWLNSDGAYYDPDNLSHRKSAYYDLPLEPDGELFRLKIYYASGAMKLEGTTHHPEWYQQELLGDFREWFEDGTEKASGHYVTRDEVCDCGNLYPVKHGTFTEYHPNGQLKSQREYIGGGLADGTYRDFDAEGRLVKEFTILHFKYHDTFSEYEDGELVSLRNYKHGQRHGEQSWFDAQGRLTRLEHYQEGKRHGVMRTFRDGVQLTDHRYEQGYQRGPQTDYHSNGQVRRTYVASNHRGKPEGDDVYYREDGGKKRHIHRVLDDSGQVTERTEKRFHDNGKLAFREQEQGDYRLREVYNADGQLTERLESDENGRQGLALTSGWSGTIREHYRDGKKHGPHLTVSDNGARKEGTYENGLKTGLWVETAADGSRVARRYKAGELHGLQESYDVLGERIEFSNYRDGKLHGPANMQGYLGHREVAEYRHGEPHGDYLKTTDDGRVLHRGQYINGKPEGVHYHFTEDGRMTAKESYQAGERHGEWIETGYDGQVVRKVTYRHGEEVANISLDSAGGGQQPSFLR